MKTKSLIYLRILLLFSLVFNLAFAYKFLYNRYYSYELDYTYNRKQLFEQFPIDSNSIVFMGNSLTQQFEIAELFKTLSVKNRGINGDNTKGLLSRLSTILKLNPKKIFIEIGINDIAQGHSEREIVDTYTEIINKSQRECPMTQLFIESVFPVKNIGKAIVNSKMTNEKIQNVNKSLKELAAQKKCTFIDTYNVFQLNGEMNPKLCLSDGLHLSGEGYLLWAKLLKPYVEK